MPEIPRDWTPAKAKEEVDRYMLYEHEAEPSAGTYRQWALIDNPHPTRDVGNNVWVRSYCRQPETGENPPTLFLVRYDEALQSFTVYRHFDAQNFPAPTPAQQRAMAKKFAEGAKE